jgi:hypothetical protein
MSRLRNGANEFFGLDFTRVLRDSNGTLPATEPGDRIRDIDTAHPLGGKRQW